MTQLPTARPVLVTETRKLQTLADHLMTQSRVAVDTESNSLFAYQEQVCLIQFTTSEGDFLLDPLALPDLTVLDEFFASEQIEKIFHAAEYDMICLRRDFDFRFNALFDTMVAARILGWKKVGLGSILESLFGVKLDKKYQRANWGQRPLSDDLLTYARLDTHFLIELRDKLRQQLENTDKVRLAKEDFARVTQVVGPKKPDEAELCFRVNGSRDLRGQELAVLQELCLFRESMARRMSRPSFKVMGDRTLLSVAQHAPKSQAALDRVPDLSGKQAYRFGRGLVSAVRRGLKAPLPRQTRRPRPDNGFLNRYDAMRMWRKEKARSLGVESDVVLPKDLLGEIARQSPAEEETLAEIMTSVPWRLENYGAEILNVIARNNSI